MVIKQLRVPELEINLPRLSDMLQEAILNYSRENHWETLDFHQLAASIENFIISRDPTEPQYEELLYIQAKLLFYAGDLMKLNDLFTFSVPQVSHVGVEIFYALGLSFQGHTREALDIINKLQFELLEDDLVLLLESLGITLFIHSIKRNYVKINAIYLKIKSILLSHTVSEEIQLQLLPWANLRQAYSIRARGQIHQAIKLLNQTLDDLVIFPNRYFHSMALTLLGQCYHNLGQIKTALDYYDQAIDIATEIQALTQLSILYNRIGMALMSNKKYKQGKDYFIKAMNFATQSGARWLTIGPLVNSVQYKLAQGQITEAITDYHTFVDIAEGTGDQQELCYALMALAELYQQLDDIPKYKFYLEKGVQLGLKLGIIQLAPSDEDPDIAERN
jgi:tetratricopeptide (TPR) repeat protein